MTATQLTDADLARLRRRFNRVADGPVRLLTPLPRRVRARLAIQGCIDRVATWLVCHNRLRAAEALWRSTGSW